MDRFEKHKEKLIKEIEWYNRYFRENEDEIEHSFVTFTRTSNHDIMVEITPYLTKLGYEVRQSNPEYDGMVRWVVKITPRVNLGDLGCKLKMLVIIK